LKEKEAKLLLEAKKMLEKDQNKPEPKSELTQESTKNE